MKLKRVLASILCVAMVLSTMGTVAFAEDETVAHLASTGDTFTTLQAAFDAVKTMDGENQIVMDKNVTENLVLDGTGYSLYMNGYTLTGQIKIVSGGLTLRGHGTSVPSTRGKIVASGTSESTYPIYCVSDYSNSAHVYFSQVDIEASDLNGTAIYMDSSALDVQLMSDVAVTGNVQVNDGTFVVNSADEESINKVNGAIVKNAPGAVDIKGGLFSEDPSDLLVAGFKAEQTSEGWEVVTESLAQTIEDFEKDAEGAYLIKTADEMVVFHTELSAGGAATFSGKVFKIANDIDLSGKTFVTTGNKNNRFAGTLDGQNYTLSNLTIDGTDKDYAALIGSLAAEGTVKNVKVNNASVTGATYTAVLVGQSRATSSIENCHVSGDINVTATGSFVAGIVGGAQNAGVNDCSVSGTGTISGSYAVGGIIGIVSEGMESINNNSVSGISVTGGQRVGGIAGSVLVAAAGLEVKNNAVENVTVSSDTSDAGLIIGQYNKVVGQVKVAENTAVESSATEAGVPVTNLYGDNLAVDYVTYVAKVGGEYYTDLKEAVKAMTAENNELNILDNITVDYKWDCRPVSKGGTGATFTFPVVINGNNNTIKFTGEINDGFNHLAVFRPEAEATFMNLTVDMSEAISVFQNRFSVISSGDSNLTVTDCNFIGSETYANARAIIFGETAEHNDAAIVVSGCTFKNFKYGVTDNLNGKDVASVEVKDSEFANASINVSASEEVIITGNEVEDGFVKVASYTQSPEQSLTVTVKDNVLDEDFAADNQIQAGAIIDAQEGFALPVASINGKKYMTLKSAVAKANDNDVIYVKPGTYTDELVINKSITITGAPEVTTFASRAAIEKPVIKIKDVTNGGVEYNAANVTFDNLVFEVAEDATGAGWNISALGYYYENTAERNGLVVTNCDFINNSDIALGAIAANIGKYTITNNTFKNFATGVWSYVDHGAADEIVVSDNAFENVANLVNIYHGVAADGTANVTIANNKATDESTTQIAVVDFGQTKATPAAAYDNVTITGNDAEVVLGNYAEASFNATIENNDSVVYSYASEAILRALESAGIPDGDVYVNYGASNEVMYKVVDGAVYAAADALEVEFELASEAEGEKIYNINLKANAQGIINRLNSADLTFLFTQVEGNNEYEIIASNSEVAINPVDNSKVRYEFHYNGKDNVLTDTDTVITIGQVKFTGYGKFNFAVDSTVDTNAAHSTTMQDNIVDTFIPGGDIATGEGDLDISDDTISGVVIAIPVRDLTINIDFPNAVADQVIAYQDMKVVISGGDLAEDITIDLGADAVETALNIFGQEEAKYVADFVDGSYVINVTDALTVNNAYTVTVSGAGYRTARYTVTMTTDKTLRFWNNVMDENQVVELGQDSSIAKVTFLAGDIVKDNNINIYDLSAVVSYFGQTNDTTAYSNYAKYDLNRDGVIDSKDVAYVLVSWNN